MKNLINDKAKNTAIDFIVQTERIFVCNKPPNFHSVGEDSLAEALAATYPQLATLPDSGLVQRLDYETEGVLVGGWNNESQAALIQLLKQGQISKSYLVLVEGRVDQRVSVSGFIGSRYRGSKKVTLYDKPHDRALEASTALEPLEYSSQHDVTLVRAHCALARRHQVRVSCASIGHPLLGDALYGSKQNMNVRLPKIPNTFLLVAERIECKEPGSGKRIIAESRTTELQLKKWIRSERT